MNSLIDELLKDYDEIHFYLQKIEGIASEQIRLLQGGDLSQLNSVLKRKDELIERMVQIQDSVEEKLSQLDFTTVPSIEKKNCEQKALTIQDKVNEIIKSEHDSLCKVVQSKTDVFKVLQKVPKAKRVLKSYHKSVNKGRYESQWEG